MASRFSASVFDLRGNVRDLSARKSEKALCARGLAEVLLQFGLGLLQDDVNRAVLQNNLKRSSGADGESIEERFHTGNHYRGAWWQRHQDSRSGAKLRLIDFASRKIRV